MKETIIGSGHPKTKFSAQRFICPRRTKGRELEAKTRDRGQRRRGRGICRGREDDKGLPLDRGERRGP